MFIVSGEREREGGERGGEREGGRERGGRERGGERERGGVGEHSHRRVTERSE